MGRCLFEPTLKEHFPFWDSLSENERESICNNTVALGYKKGTTIHDGTECSGVFLVRSGSLRVYIMSEDGKDITLYRLYKGDMCMLAASCVLQAITFDVFIDAEEDCECYIVNGSTFANICEQNPTVKIFSLETAVSRFSDVMWVLEQILFMSADKRLAIFLWDETTRTQSDEINLSHEQIAKYMGSAREVVSRLLKYFSNENIVQLSRRGVKIIDKNRLKQLTG